MVTNDGPDHRGKSLPRALFSNHSLRMYGCTHTLPSWVGLTRGSAIIILSQLGISLYQGRVTTLAGRGSNFFLKIQGKPISWF